MTTSKILFISSCTLYCTANEHSTIKEKNLERASYTCLFGREKYVLSNFSTCSDTSCIQWRGEKKLKTKQSEECVVVYRIGETLPHWLIFVFLIPHFRYYQNYYFILSKKIKTEILLWEIDFIIIVIRSRISVQYGYRFERVAMYNPEHVSCNNSVL